LSPSACRCQVQLPPCYAKFSCHHATRSSIDSIRCQATAARVARHRVPKATRTWSQGSLQNGLSLRGWVETMFGEFQRTVFNSRVLPAPASPCTKICRIPEQAGLRSSTNASRSTAFGPAHPATSSQVRLEFREEVPEFLINLYAPTLAAATASSFAAASAKAPFETMMEVSLIRAGASCDWSMACAWN
jgi:hypothetical protein